MNRAHLIRAIVGWKDNEALETQGTTGRKGLGVLCVSFIIGSGSWLHFFQTGIVRKERKVLYDYKKSGRRIAKLRKMRGYTQETFAEKISLSWRSVADIERGYRGTSVDILMDMAETLGTSVDYLLFGERRTAVESKTELSDVEEWIGKLPLTKKNLIRRMLQGMLDSLETVEILEKTG